MLKKTLIGVVLATIAVSGDASAQGIIQQTATCGKLAAETFRREPADENRVDYRAHHNIRLNKCFYEETYISLTPVGINMWVYCPISKTIEFTAGFTCPPTLAFFTAIFWTRNATRKPSGTGL